MKPLPRHALKIAPEKPTKNHTRNHAIAMPVPHYPLFINSRFVESQCGARFETFNPYTRTAWASISEAGEAPFGGFKDSGFGRKKGEAALDENLASKNVMIDFSGEASDPFTVKT